MLLPLPEGHPCADPVACEDQDVLWRSFADEDIQFDGGRHCVTEFALGNRPGFPPNALSCELESLWKGAQELVFRRQQLHGCSEPFLAHAPVGVVRSAAFLFGPADELRGGFGVVHDPNTESRAHTLVFAIRADDAEAARQPGWRPGSHWPGGNKKAAQSARQMLASLFRVAPHPVLRGDKG